MNAERKTIDFFKTSNTPIEINEMLCPYCHEAFYELDDHELEDCPLCNTTFDAEPYKNDQDSETYTLIVDHKTGIPSVIHVDEYDMVLKPQAPESTESARAV